MSDQAQTTIRIKWVRSGIGFSYKQKRIVRSLGLKKLNQEVEKPDTPQIRGLVAKVPHLVKIVEAASKPAWMSVPEYTIYSRQTVPAGPAEAAIETPAAGMEKAEAPVPPPLPLLPSRGGESGVGATGDVGAAPAMSADEQQTVEAQAAPEAVAETSGDSTGTEIRKFADASGIESAKAGEEVSAEEGESEA